ncbi:hypothetical protein [Rudaea sp.]|uniref:hypothetical protein n=1 Tax=Rudaea sp. TaxID=2136325 RepID=UPI0039E5298B
MRIVTKLAALGVAALFWSGVAGAREITCEMHFSLSGWSAFYKTASGTGLVSCSNGAKMKVDIRTKGGGITFGKSEIKNGYGKFTHLYDIEDVLGSYATAGAHAGAVNSAEAQAMTKGPVSLAVSGKGKGWDLGFAFGKFTILRPGADPDADEDEKEDASQRQEAVTHPLRNP